MKNAIWFGRIQIIIIILFVFSKSWLRPFVLKRDAPVFLDITVLSLPNLYEGVVGVLVLSFMGLYINKRWNKSKLGNHTIYILATILAAIFVITQEVKLHNLGGNNVYDPYDVIFSFIGLTLGFTIVWMKGPTAD
ncbi:hypothetical protein [Ekhidna sp.]|uniref:hypothetical protein n=1 Tax=Ekhidna sp. TaxID=2608089 RepID=UPI003CCBAE97